MKLKTPRSLQSWLFSAGVLLLLLMALISWVASILAAHERARAQGGTNIGIAATRLAFETPVSILEFAGLSCLILAALVSIFRTILPSKPK
jgi:hypothetical protein